ncbi:hypothetical protein TRV_02225 [Trichophyton verrucosum HKI 0517]|uniref:Uncharacterized protein n=1 Tax=Trichophyton verrucosum (strain HKI 0517) TaxID=663202 RepID=D4D555_TRIVH|nr:uncharacterized protein TRV_02225 [Trichophyton verrucosum HKI 0517]EFE43032.1 hypothetical protein TRV_02225 [Trichophyton verrucosum HKI 0517]
MIKHVTHLLFLRKVEFFLLFSFFFSSSNKHQEEVEEVKNLLRPASNSFKMRPKVSIAHLARHGGLSLAELPPPFLAPALYSPIISVSRSSKFSTSASFQDRNKNRGVSAIHRSGLKHRLSVSKFKLPVPENPERHEPRVLNPEHGLWEFFLPNKQAFPTPEQEHAHGMGPPRRFQFINPQLVLTNATL